MNTSRDQADQERMRILTRSNMAPVWVIVTVVSFGGPAVLYSASVLCWRLFTGN